MYAIARNHVDYDNLRSQLLGSFLKFKKVFYELLTNREYVSSPHLIEFSRQFTRAFNLQVQNLQLRCPPGWHKSTECQLFVAWCFAHYADCQFMYISYSHERATENTYAIKRIMSLSLYQELFGVKIASDSKAKDSFKTTGGGSVIAHGSDGGITGGNAGLPHLNRFSGGLIMDDMHKAQDIESEVKRLTVINNYQTALKSRRRGPNVPFISIGQCLRQGDLNEFLSQGLDGNKWEIVEFQAEDKDGNPNYPAVHTKEFLESEKKFNEYVYYAQYMQRPLPPGGGMFKEEHFYLTDEEPEFIATFLTVDTAETNKNYNDATVFSFWGYYNIEHNRVITGEKGLHLIDCVEIRVNPDELENSLMEFYGACMSHKKPPEFIAIEKKSTGVTLSAVLNKVRGLNIRNIERTSASGGKITRYQEMVPIIAKKLISIHRYARHAKMFLEHMKKITRNETHAHDDICDTVYDAVKIAYIDKSFDSTSSAQDEVVKEMARAFNRRQQIMRGH